MKTNALFAECVSKIPNDIHMKVDWSFAIADKIAEILEQQGMTQKDLAKKMGKTESEVSRWLCGTHNFSLNTISKISDALNYPLIKVN